ncbi:MAG: hypothetical protein EA424_21500 [Planctomycetaceae bacterium]|nr:MAG: hypothetical protein EA424_21500 [Planctomycetaceae bacterium]
MTYDAAGRLTTRRPAAVRSPPARLLSGRCSTTGVAGPA